MPEALLELLVIPLVKIVVLLGVVLLIVAYLTYAERKILAYMQVRLGPNRVGPKGWLQPIADGLKLFVKEDLIPGSAEKFVFVLAPSLIMVPALLMFAVIAFGEPFEVAGSAGRSSPCHAGVFSPNACRTQSPNSSRSMGFFI